MIALSLAVAAAVVLTVRLWRVNRALRERAARVAHEIRQPLCAAQLGLHGAARRGEIGPTLVAALEFELRRAAFALEDPAAARPADVDLHALLDCQVRTWREVAAAHGASLDLDPGPGTAVVHADALRLAQATSNVVANAIEHGGGRIVIRTVRVADRIRVEVADGGRGPLRHEASQPIAGGGSADAEHGRGLAIVSLLTLSWGSASDSTSAVVWAEVPVRQSAEAEAEQAEQERQEA